MDLLVWRNQTPPRPAVPELVKVKEASLDITNHVGRGRMNLGRSRFAGLAAGLCAIALLLGLGLRPSFAEDFGTSTPIWQAGTVNCTGFISDVASYMGLRTPALPTLMYPEDLVKAIKELNGGRQEMPSHASAHESPWK
jgi:hypothetical protein